MSWWCRQTSNNVSRECSFLLSSSERKKALPRSCARNASPSVVVVSVQVALIFFFFILDLFRSIDVKCCYQLCLFMHIQVQLEILMSSCLWLVRQHSTLDPWSSVVLSSLLLFENKRLENEPSQKSKVNVCSVMMAIDFCAIFFDAITRFCATNEFFHISVQHGR